MSGPEDVEPDLIQEVDRRFVGAVPHE